MPLHGSIGIALTVGFLAGCSNQAGSQAEPDPCIAGAVLDLTGLNEARRVEVANQFAGTVARDSSRSLGGVAVQSDRVYFQFRKQCDRKQELVVAILQRMAEADPDFPKYVLIEDPIAPSPNTMDLNGEATR
jgi:hypothetical protein